MEGCAVGSGKAYLVESAPCNSDSDSDSVGAARTGSESESELTPHLNNCSVHVSGLESELHGADPELDGADKGYACVSAASRTGSNRGQISVSQSQSYTWRTHQRYACVERSKKKRIKQESEQRACMHFGNASEETAPRAPLSQHAAGAAAVVQEDRAPKISYSV
eukprot:352575-Chlamydomonas_euryale.AAC.1